MTSVSSPASRWERFREPALFTVGLAWMLVVEVKNFLRMTATRTRSGPT